jgi:hypothetical protein
MALPVNPEIKSGISVPSMVNHTMKAISTSEITVREINANMRREAAASP